MVAAYSKRRERHDSRCALVNWQMAIPTHVAWFLEQIIGYMIISTLVVKGNIKEARCYFFIRGT